MRAVTRLLASIAAIVGATLAACSHDATSPGAITSCAGVSFGTPPANGMSVLGIGVDTMRYTAEVAVSGSVAYTTTWQVRHAQGNKVNIWDVSGACPVLIDSLIVSGAITTGDATISDDGSLLMIATEYGGGSVVIYSLADPKHPALLTRFTNDQLSAGVHTAKFGRVNGKLYAFASVDPIVGGPPAKLAILDVSTPSAPVQVFVKTVGNPYVHDTYIRDGYLFVALWNDGLDIWDIGGGNSGATPAAPKVLGNVKTLGGEVHNVWWYHDASGGKKFAFVGEEGPGSVGTSSRGDIHVVDVSDFTAPKEVAFYHVDGAGTHNFSIDEAKGILYAAYYNAGVRALDVHGDLGTCAGNQQNLDAVNNITRCDLRLMGREVATGLTSVGRQVYIWGVQYSNGNVFASDMLSGLWKLGAAR